MNLTELKQNCHSTVIIEGISEDFLDNQVPVANMYQISSANSKEEK